MMPSIPQQKAARASFVFARQPTKMVIAAVQWAKRIMGKIDEECGK
jgi:hypothetical protein